MHADSTRRTLLAGGAALALALGTRRGAVALADSLPEVTVYKSPT